MALNPAISFTATGGANTLSGVTSTSANSSTLVVDIAFTAAASTPDQLYTVALDVSEIETVFLYADGAVTLETNSSSAADQTLTFAANLPLVWVRGMPTTCPFTVDVTKFYFTVAGGSVVNIYGTIGLSL